MNVGVDDPDDALRVYAVSHRAVASGQFTAVGGHRP